MHVQDDLNLEMFKGTFSLDVAHMVDLKKKKKKKKKKAQVGVRQSRIYFLVVGFIEGNT